RIIRNGQALTPAPGLYLRRGDQIRARGPTSFKFSYAGRSYRILYGLAHLECRTVLLGSQRKLMLTVGLQFGRVAVRSGAAPSGALILTPEMLSYATSKSTVFVVERNQRTRSTQAWTLNNPIVAAEATDQSLRINSRVTYTAISDAKGLRLDIWPFSISPLQRATTRADGLPAFWADGKPCSVGCTAPGAIPGWPLQPFHQQHA